MVITAKSVENFITYMKSIQGNPFIVSNFKSDLPSTFDFPEAPKHTSLRCVLFCQGLSISYSCKTKSNSQQAEEELKKISAVAKENNIMVLPLNNEDTFSI